jgi:hypothetical protein
MIVSSGIAFPGVVRGTAGPSATLRFGRDDKFVGSEILNYRSLGCARDDKGEGGAPIWCDCGNDNPTDVVHSRLNCRWQVRLLLMTQGERTIGLVPRLRRSDHFWIDFPALPGWADVWRSALRALCPWRFLPCHFSLSLPQVSRLLPTNKRVGCCLPLSPRC